MTQLDLEDVRKVFGDPDGTGVVAVDDVSLSVADGEFLVLLGPSGCGKTTTLRMVAGLEVPTSGTISFDGVDVNNVKARNRDVAMVFQDFALYPHMSVRGNLGFGLKREDNDLTGDEIEAAVEDVAQMLEIEELLDKRPAELSGGQKQRVALGRAIVREPRVFLFDEPLANLDASLRKTMRTEIDELQSEVGITSVYVTHNQEEAMSIADKIAIMRDGRLHQLGTPNEVFNEPRNLFVAQFVGSPDMNLYDARMTPEGDAYNIDTGNIAFEMPKALLDHDVDTEEVIVGFRPQDLYQLRTRRTDGPDIPTDIRIIEPLGTEAVLYANVGDEAITAKVGQFDDIVSGDTVTLTIAPEHIYIFEPDTEELIKGRMSITRTEDRAPDEVEA